jgi:hypothetical protein
MPSRRCSWQIATPGSSATGPFTLAGDHEIEVELADQAHAVRAGGIVDAGEGFVEQHQAGRKGVAGLAVEARDGGEQRYRQAERAFAARGRAGERTPPVLPALNAKAMPAPVVERLGELLGQAAAGRRPSGVRRRALVQHLADHRRSSSDHRSVLVLSRRCARPPNPPARRRRLGQRLPQEAELDPGGRRALAELFVDRVDLPLGGLQGRCTSAAISAWRWFSSSVRSRAVKSSRRWAISASSRAVSWSGRSGRFW